MRGRPTKDPYTRLASNTLEREAMGLVKTEEEWGTRASAFLKAKMKEGDITYAELAKRLKKHGLKETGR